MRTNWTAILSMTLAIVTLTAEAQPRSAESKDVTCKGKVVDEQGRPIGVVKITLHEMVQNEADYTYDLTLLGQVQTGTDGAFSFDETLDSGGYRYAYVVAEKEGFALGFDNWNMRDGDREIQIKLGPPKGLAGTVVDEKDAPVSDAQVSVSMLVLGEGEGRKNLGGFVATKLLAASTDATGKFAFTCIPTGATAEFVVSKAGRATVSTYKRTGAAYEKLSFTQGQTDIKLVLPTEAKIEGVVVNKSTGKPVGGVQVRYASEQQLGYFRPKPVVSDLDGVFHIDALACDQYILDLVQPSLELPDWIADPAEVITESGKTTSGIKIEVSRGGFLEVILLP